MTGFKNTWVYKEFQKVFGDDSLIADVFHSTVDEIAAYEKTHGKADLELAFQAGQAGYNAARAAGKKVGEALIDGVAAFFLSEAKDIKTISTEAATAALAGKVK